MGIQGLWQVLEPTGRPVNIHSLRGKVLAVDVSIWLHQLVKGFRDKDGNPLPNAHLLGVFHRVCKLLNYGIKPVFVFDGGVPALKRQTLAARRGRKLESLDKAELSRQKILSAYLQQQLLRQSKQSLPPSLRMQQQISRLASGSSKRSPSGSPKKQPLRETTASSKATNDDVVDEDLAAFKAALVAKLEDDVEEVDPKYENDSSDGEDDGAGHKYHYGVDYSENFSVIQAPSFDTLPLETQHEILFEMQESRKMNSWGKFDKMPKDLQSFSSFQMDRLVKRRTLQKKIQTVQQEMGQRHIHVQNLDDLLKMDYSAFENQETKVATSKNDGFVLIQSQEVPKKKDGSIKDEPTPGTSTSNAEPQLITIDDYIEDSFSDEDEQVHDSSTSKSAKVPENTNKAQVTEGRSNVNAEEEEDLKLAIQLSLMESKKEEERKNQPSSSSAFIDEDIDIETASVKETTEEEVKVGQNETSNSKAQHLQSNPLETIQSSQMSHCAKFLDTIGFHVPLSSQSTLRSSQAEEKATTSNRSEAERSFASKPSSSVTEDPVPNNLVVVSSDDDDDFEDVETVEKEPKLVLTLNLSEIKTMGKDEDDMFADVFNGNENNLDVHKPTIIQEQNGKRLPLPEEIMDAANNSENLADKVEVPERYLDKWDSDGEIEADLIDMVVAESLNSVYQADANEKVNASESDFRPSTSKAPDTISRQPETELLSESTPLSSGKRKEESVKIVTAEYMQAQEQLNSKLEKLHSEKGQQERIATSISDQMQIETQELISLFGIPYVVSPTEAESQCAFLDKACLTEGSLTDDSDVWLFGGQRVYKNFFSQGERRTEFYQAADIQRILNLNREKLIVLAMMTGSDYSDGIQGVGPVLALEILSEFSSAAVDGYECLVKFKEWWDDIQTKQINVFSGSKLKERLRKLKVNPGFPNQMVYDAFISPTIDTSTEAFKWGNPDLDAIRGYTKQKFGWEQTKCDSLLLPVLKNLRCEAEQSRQLTLDSYISIGKMPTLESGKRKKGSKRVETAVKKLKRIGVESHELNLSSESSDSETDSKVTRKSTPPTTLTTKKRKLNTGNKRGESSGQGRKKANNPAEDQVVVVPTPSSKAVVSPVIPRKEVIPQRVQSESDKIKNKQKAIEIFNKRKGT